MFEEGLENFNLEAYEEAQKFLKQSIDKVDEIEAELAVSRATGNQFQEKISVFLIENYFYVILSIPVILAASFLVRRGIGGRKKRKRLHLLDSEIGTTENLIRKTQKRYFEDGAISKNEYTATLSKYQKRLNEVKKDIIIIKGH